MKLNNAIRDAFVRAAISHVPAIDYQEQADKLLLAEASRSLPSRVRVVYDDPELRGYVKADKYTYMPSPLHNLYVCCADGYEKSPELMSSLNELAAQLKQQNLRRGALGSKLRDVAYSVSTRKALVELLPEFEKYLPEVPEKSRQLPAVANLMAEFVEAGWPKGKAAS